MGSLNDGTQIFIKVKDDNNTSYQNDSIMNIFFKFEKTKINVIIPYDKTVKDLIHAFFNKIRVAEQNQKFFSFYLNNTELKINGNQIYKAGFYSGIVVDFKTNIVKNDYNYSYLKSNCPGKKINAILKDKNQRINLNLVICAGTLQQIKNEIEYKNRYYTTFII